MKLSARTIAGVLLPTAAALAMTPGCSHINVADYSGFTNIPPGGMPTGWEYEFAPQAFDSTLRLDGHYEVVIAVRYTNQCPSRNVIFNIEELSLAHETPDSTVAVIPLFDQEGQPSGQTRYGVNETFYTLRNGFKVPEGYVLSLSSPLPADATAGVKAVGLMLVNEDTREKQKQLFWQFL